MKILITGVGGPTPRSFAMAIKKIGLYKDAFLIGTDINPLAIGLYQKDLFNESYIIPRADDPKYWTAIEDIVERHEIELAVILPEMEVLEWSKRKVTHKIPCKVLLPDYNLAKHLVDKSLMTELLDESGLVPHSISFRKSESDLNKVFSKIGERFWVRSAAGTSGLGSMLITSKEQLTTWISINPKVEHFLASEYLPGRNLACKLLFWEGQLIRSACAERVEYIMAKVAPSGITGNTSFGRLLNEPKLVNTAIKAMKIIAEKLSAPLQGFFTVDFKEDEEGRPLITEVNVRHVAFTQCFAAGGANLAEDTIRLLSDDPSFDKSYRMYEFEPGLIFLRDVDALPILMKGIDLFKRSWA